MKRRTVIRGTEGGRLARRTGILRAAPPESPTALIIESGAERLPLVVLAPHQVNVGGALLADLDGTPVAWDGDRVILAGGLASQDDERYPAFLAWMVSVDTG